MIQKYRDRAMELWDEYFEKAKTFWLGLAPREKLIVSVLAGVAGLLLAVLVLKEVNTFFFEHSAQAEANLNNIEKIKRHAGELLRQRSDLMVYERLKGKRGQNFRFKDFLESEAGQYGVSIAKVSPTQPRTTAEPTKASPPAKGAKPTPKPSTDDMEFLEVQMGPDTTLEPLMKFLESVENTLGVQIVELSIKPSFADATKLEVVAVVANLKDM